MLREYLLGANPRLAERNARVVGGNFDMGVNLQAHPAEISFQPLRKIGVLKNSAAKGDTIEACSCGGNHCSLEKNLNYAVVEARGDSTHRDPASHIFDKGLHYWELIDYKGFPTGFQSAFIMSFIRFDRLFEFDCRLPFVIDKQAYPAKSGRGVEKPAARRGQRAIQPPGKHLQNYSCIPCSLLPAPCIPFRPDSQ